MRIDDLDVQDLDARIPAMHTRRPPTRPADDIPARWRERSDLVGYAACTRQPSPDYDGTMIYQIIGRAFPNSEQADNVRKSRAKKLAGTGVDVVLVELREIR